VINEIFIESRRVDMASGLSNLLTYSIDDIKDIGSRNTTFSKTIVLPGTALNNHLFGHIFDVSVSNLYNDGEDNIGYNFNASKQADCIIFQNHIQIFKGIIRITRILVNNRLIEYECVVFGELGGFVNSIGASKLQDLDFSDYDHLLALNNISGSWDNIGNGTGYFYPLADYGNVSQNKVDYDYRAFRPALFVKEYIDKIFTNSGYTYECDLFDTERFKRLVIPHNQKQLTKNENEWIVAERIDIGDYDIIENASPDNSYEWSGSNLINFTTPDQKEFTYTGVNGVTAVLHFIIHGDITNNGANIEYQIRQNGTALLTGAMDDTGGFTEEFLIEETVSMNLQNGDVIDIYFIGSGGGTFNVGSDVGEMTLTTDLPQVVPVELNDTVQVTDCIPRNILQRDFFSSILRLFNLYVYEDKLKPKHLSITPYVEFYDTNVSGVLDWSWKMDMGRTIELIPMGELNSRFYDFKFKQDSDYYNDLYRNRYGENYGDYLYDSEFAFSGDRTPIELIFSGTPLVGYSGVDKIVSTYYRQSAAGIEQELDVNIRILQAKKITGITAWSIKDDVTVLQSGITSYGYAGHYDDPDAPANDIHFGVPKELFFTLLSGAINVTQFNVYWSPYMAEISDKDSKLMIAYFKLTNRDIYNLDFSKLIYVSGSYFRLNKIEDWNASELDVCKVELLKVINTVY
jgi:hypothetical protein